MTENNGSLSLTLVILKYISLPLFQAKYQSGFHLKISFTENCECADVQNRVWGYIQRGKPIVLEDPAKEKRPGRTETPGHMIEEYYYLTFARGRPGLLTSSVLADLQF